MCPVNETIRWKLRKNKGSFKEVLSQPLATK